LPPALAGVIAHQRSFELVVETNVAYAGFTVLA
jgi:hypothetical protein